MKKNGRKYRKVEKRDIKNQIQSPKDNMAGYSNSDYIDNRLSVARIVQNNPVIRDNVEVKKEYLRRLKRYLEISIPDYSPYEEAMYNAYKKIILNEETEEEIHNISFYTHYILFDLLHIWNYEPEKIPKEKLEFVKRQYERDFFNNDGNGTFDRIMKSVKVNGREFNNLMKREEFKEEKFYISLMKKNVRFRKKVPYRIMVTATMSAGKSTFINALIGRYACLSQNMACTSKIHSILGKAYDDGVSYKYDYEYLMDAGKEELLKNNEKNTTNKVIVSTYFSGELGGKRVVINDSPGVNYSGDKSHEAITDNLIKSREYDLIIYIMNATQLATNDEDRHLEYVKKMKGNTPILFVMNKVDSFSVEEENIKSILERQREYLKRKGFKNPIVCPVSARAGYLAKLFDKEQLSKSEKRELYNYVDKFEQVNLPYYYRKYFKNIRVQNTKQEEKQLIKTCGLAYVEKIISRLTKGGQVNGTGLC